MGEKGIAPKLYVSNIEKDAKYLDWNFIWTQNLRQKNKHQNNYEDRYREQSRERERS